MATLAEYYFDIKLPAGALEQAQKKVTKLDISFISLMTSIVALQKVSTAALSIFKGVTDEFAEFEYVMKGVKAVSGATEREFKKLWDTARELGSTTRYSGVEVGHALETLALLGLTASQSIRAIPQVLNLAATEGINLKDAAEIAIGSMNSMKLGIKDLSMVNDALAYTATQSASTIYDLGSAVKVVGSMATNAGQDLSSVLAVLGGLSNQMIRAENAGHAVGQMLARLIRASSDSITPIDEVGTRLDKARETVRKLGIEIMDTTTGKMRPLTDILYEMSEAGMTTTQLLSIFGIYTVKAAASAINAAGKIKDMERALRATGDAVKGTAERIAKMRMDSLRGEALELTNTFKDLRIEIGEKAAPGLSAFMQILKSLLYKASEWIKQNEELTAKIITFVGVLGGLGVVATIIVGIFFALYAGATPLVLAFTGLYLAARKITDVLSEVSKKAKEHNNGIVTGAGVVKELNNKYGVLIDTLTILKGVYKDISTTAGSAGNQTGLLAKGDKATGGVFAQGFWLYKKYDEGMDWITNKLIKWDNTITKKWADHYRKRETMAGDFNERMKSIYSMADTEMLSPTFDWTKQGESWENVWSIPKREKSIFGDMEEYEKVSKEYYNTLDELYDTVEDRTLAHYKVKKEIYALDAAEQIKTIEQMAKTGKISPGEAKTAANLVERAFKRKLELDRVEMKKAPIEEKLQYYEQSMKMSQGEYELKKELIALEMKEIKHKIKEETELKQIEIDKRLQLEQEYIDRMGGLENTMYSEMQRMTDRKYAIELDYIERKYELYKQDASNFTDAELWKQEKLLELNKEKIKDQGSLVDGFRVYYDELKQAGWSWAQAGYDAAQDMQSGVSSSFYNFFENMRTDAKNWKEHLVQLFGDFASAFAQAMQRMIAAWIAAKIIGMFLGMLSPAAGPTQSTAGAEYNPTGGANSWSYNGNSTGYVKPNSTLLDRGTRFNPPGRDPMSSGRSTIIQNITIPISAMDSQDVDRALRKGGTSAIRKAVLDGVVQSEGYAKSLRGK